jgi:prepilin-type N-terminal cleavage/methylation domain-containing protein
MKKAFTLLEVLCVMGILALLAAILFPLMFSAKTKAKVTTSASNLKQIYMQTVLYQDQHDGAGVYGSIYSMGLPPWPQSDKLDLLKKLRPPMAPHPLSRELGVGYYSMYTQPELDQMPLTWTEYANSAGPKSILYVDPFNNDPQISLTIGNYVTRHFLAINLAGSLRNVHGQGDWLMRGWWLEKEENK